MAGFSVYVSDNSTHFRNGHLCFHHNALSLPALILEFQCRIHGRYFTFYNERRQDVKYPEAYSTYAIVELCEVEILGKWILNILENGFPPEWIFTCSQNEHGNKKLLVKELYLNQPFANFLILF